MRRYLALAGIISAVFAAAACADETEHSTFRIIGYLPDYRLSEFDLKRVKKLTDVIVFSAEPSADGSLDTQRLQNCPWPQLLKLKTESRVRLLLTIGGWERSGQFPAVAMSKDLRARFVSEVVDFCLKRRFDGVDIDWEHPEGPQQEQDYALLLSDLRAAFDPHGLLLSVTIAAWQKLQPEAVAAVHYVQVMAYDHEKQHSTFDGAVEDIRKLRRMNIPAKKIVMGLPFYGRDLKTREALTWREITEDFRPNPDQDEVRGVYFNGPETIRRKTQYAVKERLAGVMIWELGQDALGDASLLRVICESVE